MPRNEDGSWSLGEPSPAEVHGNNEGLPDPQQYRLNTVSNPPLRPFTIESPVSEGHNQALHADPTPEDAPPDETTERRPRHRARGALKTFAVLALLGVALDAGYIKGIEGKDISDTWQAQIDNIAAGYFGKTTEHLRQERLRQHQSQSAPSSVATQNVTPTAIPTPSATPQPSSSPALTPAQCVSQLPEKVKWGQMIFAPLTAESIKLPATQKAFNDHYIGGAILMTAPANPADGSIKAFSNTQTIPIRIATDQEGGTVQRFKKAPAALPSAAEAAKMTPAEVTAKATAAYSYLRSLGITAVFAPVADVAPLKGTTNIGETRLFSSDPKIVATYDKAYIDAAKSAKMHISLKHFPGMGSADGNTDKTGGVKDPSLTELKKRDLVPYEILKDSGADVMVGSPVVPGLTDGKPANMSPATYKLLRSMGYENAITYTDDLSTPAIRMRLEDAFVAAWRAGADMPLFVNIPKGETLDSQLDKIIAAGEKAYQEKKITTDQLNGSVARILGSKGLDACGVLKGLKPETSSKQVSSTPTAVKSTASASTKPTTSSKSATSATAKK